MGDFFNKVLELDAWYKVVVYLSLVGLLASLCWEVKAITNSQLLIFSVGSLLLGSGEWRNHLVQRHFLPPNIYFGGRGEITRLIWRPTLIGILLDLAGLSILAIGIRNVLGI